MDRFPGPSIGHTPQEGCSMVRSGDSTVSRDNWHATSVRTVTRRLTSNLALILVRSHWSIHFIELISDCLLGSTGLTVGRELAHSSLHHSEETVSGQC